MPVMKRRRPSSQDGRRISCECIVSYVSGGPMSSTSPARITGRGWLRDLALALTVRRGRPPLVLHLHGSECDRLGRPGEELFTALSALLARRASSVMLLSTEELPAWRRTCPQVQFDVVVNPFVPTADRPRAADTTAVRWFVMDAHAAHRCAPYSREGRVRSTRRPRHCSPEPTVSTPCGRHRSSTQGPRTPHSCAPPG